MKGHVQMRATDAVLMVCLPPLDPVTLVALISSRKEASGLLRILPSTALFNEMTLFYTDS